MSFDKKRKNNPCCNKTVYAWEGFKKLMCMGQTRADQYIRNIVIKDEQTNAEELLVTTEQGQEGPSFQGRPVTLLFLNINSYAAGTKNVWRKSGNKRALVTEKK